MSEKVSSEHLDRKFAKVIFQYIYFFGFGYRWYEPKERTHLWKTFYKFWSFVSNFYIISSVISEVLANFRTDLDQRERNDVILFSIAHTTILIKFIFFYLNRYKIQDCFKKLVEETRTSLTFKTEGAAVKKSKKYVVIIVVTMALTMILSTIDAIKRYVNLGIPFQVLTPVWPQKHTYYGFFPYFCQAMVQLFWWYLIAMMVAVDSVCVTALIFLEYKFKTLELYFLEMRKTVMRDIVTKPKEVVEKEFEEAFVAGIKLHSETLWCAKSLQRALGNVYSVQVVQSISLLSMCLIKLVAVERSFTFLLANLAFINCMLALTGTYMLTCGDITYAASQVSKGMFFSGWELCSNKRIRNYLVVAIQRSQVPVVMTAFGIYDLSYSNFISVARSSYSFFAVMY